MSLESWKAEFYPIPANEVPEEDAIRHSLQKWRGLTTENLERHGMEWDKESGDIVEIDGECVFDIDGDSCALCTYYFGWGKYDAELCSTCPLQKTMGDKCMPFERENAFGEFVMEGNPLPMIEALEKTLANSVVK